MSSDYTRPITWRDQVTIIPESMRREMVKAAQRLIARLMAPSDGREGFRESQSIKLAEQSGCK